MDSTGSNSSVQDAEVATTGADIVVALTSYNDVRTIGTVARALRDGLAPRRQASRAHFVLADAGSTDGTREAAREALGPADMTEVSFDRATTFTEVPYHGFPHRVAALRAVYESALRLDAKALVVLDAALQVVEPNWIEQLVGPVLDDGFDYVSPLYARHVHEGAITKSIVYPMFRSMYGLRLRQPAASEFGCSRRAIEHYVGQPFWEWEHAPAGIDLWFSVEAACADLRVCEAALGSRGGVWRSHASDLSSTVAQVVGALFVDVAHHVDVWQRIRGSEGIPLFGTSPASLEPVAAMGSDPLLESFRLGYRELREVWTWVLPPRTIVELRRLATLPPSAFRIDDRFWASIVYDFALGHAMHVMPRDHLLRSLTPLYTGWLASFVLEMQQASPAQADERIERLCRAFEAEKGYLISRWRWPERLR